MNVIICYMDHFFSPITIQAFFRIYHHIVVVIISKLSVTFHLVSFGVEVNTR